MQKMQHRPFSSAEALRKTQLHCGCTSELKRRATADRSKFARNGEQAPRAQTVEMLRRTTPRLMQLLQSVHGTRQRHEILARRVLAMIQK
jgi:hypothetical protein